MLSDALADLADDLDGPGHARTVPDLAATAWSRGRRRRRRVRSTRVALAAAAVVAVVVAVLPGSWDRDALPAAPSGSVTLGHPVRIARPWSVSDLPRRGEPLAAVALSEGMGRNSGWYGVTQDGGLRRLPVRGGFMDGVVPALSADGRVLGYVDSGDGRYRIHDVVTGRTTTFPEVGTTAYPDAQHEPTYPYGVGAQTPGYVSPDGTRVALAGATTGNDGSVAILVLGTDGSVRPLAADSGYSLAGWLDDHTVLAVAGRDSGPDTDLTTTLTPVALGLDGSVRRLPVLRPATPVSGFAYSQWSPSLSPDRRSLAIGLGGDQHDSGPGSGSGSGSGSTVLVFDVASGREVDTSEVASPFLPPTTASHAGAKHLEWRGATWYGTPPGEVVTAVAPRTTGAPALVADPALRLGWLDLADDALAGPAHSSLLGTHTGWAAWHWRELLLGAAALMVLGLTRRGLLSAAARTGGA
ncbi:hypothetical protein [Phycicoccus sp. Soil748]|uniref:hypothetical protein n=1 Tax=Phycicoccus sp. Soil748 TaxID=1736397 RepID=UPI0012E39909|nr:hypothetical protein [Phycicoccus sp. Soil748]